MKKIKYYIYLPAFTFLLSFFGSILKDKLDGPGGRGYYWPSDPLSWSEIINKLPRYTITSLIISIFSLIIVREIIKKDKKDKQRDKEKEAKKMVSNPNTHECRVCGYHNNDYPWGEDGKSPNYELCPCCGVQYGVKDITPEEIQNERKLWVKNKYKWFDSNLKPAGWSSEEQLKNIPKIGIGEDNV